MLSCGLLGLSCSLFQIYQEDLEQFDDGEARALANRQGEALQFFEAAQAIPGAMRGRSAPGVDLRGSCGLASRLLVLKRHRDHPSRQILRQNAQNETPVR